MTKRFALVGAAGYVAPRHMQAIKDVGGELVAALDPHDSVGILDSYAPNCLYFREPERFDRWLSKNHVDYVSVCSPNYLHDSHCLMAMRNGADVICEKPLVCNERNLDNLAEWEVKTGRKVNAILQCRLHQEAIRAKEGLCEEPRSIMVDYNVPRGAWYQHSWKADVSKSGGISTNIGVHLFDLCIWLLGDLSNVFAPPRFVAEHFPYGSRGLFSTMGGSVVWSLSISPSIPKVRKFKILKHSHEIRGSKKHLCRKEVDELDLTNGFEDLHALSYQKILAGEGFTIEHARPAIRLVEEIRNAS